MYNIYPVYSVLSLDLCIFQEWFASRFPDPSRGLALAAATAIPCLGEPEDSALRCKMHNNLDHPQTMKRMTKRTTSHSKVGRVSPKNA